MLPFDTQFVLTKRGGLVTSPFLGTYCPVMIDEVQPLTEWLKRVPKTLVCDASCPSQTSLQPNLSDLPESLIARLQKHGFDQPPRPYRPAFKLIQFQVTNACNLRCAYCSAASGCARANELTLTDVKRIIDEITELRPGINVSFSGGEPLLVPWIIEAIDYAAERSKKPVGLLSNLLMLNHNETLFNNLVKRMTTGLNVQVSLSGADREVCDRISGRPCFDESLEVIQKLHNAGVTPAVDIMLSAPDIDANIRAFAQLRRRLPSEIKISVAPIYPCGRETGEHCFTSESELQSALDEIAFEGGVSIAAPQKSFVTYRRRACQCIENQNLFVRSDGTIYSCFKMVEPFGHVSEGIKTVLERRSQANVMAADLVMCKTCPFVSLCASGCRADNIILQQNTQAPICGEWRKQLIAEKLFDDDPNVLNWPIHYQISEARKLGIKTPNYVITHVL